MERLFVSLVVFESQAQKVFLLKRRVSDENFTAFQSLKRGFQQNKAFFSIFVLICQDVSLPRDCAQNEHFTSAAVLCVAPGSLQILQLRLIVTRKR